MESGLAVQHRADAALQVHGEALVHPEVLPVLVRHQVAAPAPSRSHPEVIQKCCQFWFVTRLPHQSP
eukprot:1179596-Prorocentrum_minimum.AAC.1